MPAPSNHPSLRLVVTLGPASFDLGSSLAQAGATCFRLNASHMEPERLAEVVANLRQDDRTASLPIVVDLQGAKMRFDEYSRADLVAGQKTELRLSRKTKRDLVVPHPELFDGLRPGETLHVDDDKLRFRVLEVAEDHCLVESLSAGEVLPRKAVNVAEHPVRIERLTDRDRQHVQLCARFDNLGFAVSFMENGREAAWIGGIAPGRPVVGKVERREAIANLERIARRVDEIWIARGDLGAQLGLPAMARWLHDFDPRAVGVPVLMAGQVLACLEHRAQPSRTEVAHLYDLLARGFAGIVLSDETASGVDPVAATREAASLLSACSESIEALR